MKMTVLPSRVSGTVDAVPSKSHAHRLLIAAALADAPAKVICPALSRDIERTAECLAALGATVTRTEDGFEVTPISKVKKGAVLNAGESGSTLRFLLPVACALGADATFTGEGRLPFRPLGTLTDALTRGGASISSPAAHPDTDSASSPSLPLTTGGKLAGGEFAVDASVSSQYVSGMLFALASLGNKCTLNTIGSAVSEGYTEMTLDALALFGKRVKKTAEGYLIPDGGLHSPGTVRAEGDWSSAAFMLAAGALAGDVTVTGLDSRSAQRDKQIADILAEMGAEVSFPAGDRCRVKAAPLRAVRVDVDDIPDLAPVLSVLMAAAEGESVMTGVARLRDKESDRLAAIVHNLSAMGIDAEIRGNSLLIRGGKIKNFAASGFGDHRMVMSAAVAGLLAGGEVTDAEAAAKSYPAFFRDLKLIGGKTHETV